MEEYPLLPEELTLIEVGIRGRVKSLYGKIDPGLMKAAREHARYQAKLGVQGHQGFQQRYERLSPLFKGLEVTEICAESWDWEVMHLDASRSMYTSWKASAGHWQVANGKAKFIGYSMARGVSKRTGKPTWYACGIVAR